MKLTHIRHLAAIAVAARTSFRSLRRKTQSIPTGSAAGTMSNAAFGRICRTTTGRCRRTTTGRSVNSYGLASTISASRRHTTDIGQAGQATLGFSTSPGFPRIAIGSTGLIGTKSRRLSTSVLRTGISKGVRERSRRYTSIRHGQRRSCSSMGFPKVAASSTNRLALTASGFAGTTSCTSRARFALLPTTATGTRRRHARFVLRGRRSG